MRDRAQDGRLKTLRHVMQRNRSQGQWQGP